MERRGGRTFSFVTSFPKEEQGFTVRKKEGGDRRRLYHRKRKKNGLLKRGKKKGML